MKVSAEGSMLFKAKVEFLEFVVSSICIKYYRRFIKDFASVAKLLTEDVTLT